MRGLLVPDVHPAPGRPEPVRFHFDPSCPWCYQTSRWVRRLDELGTVEVSWGLFSLELANAEDPVNAHLDRTAQALRTCMVVRDQEGDAALGRFYAALGRRVHEAGERLADPEVVEAALKEAGLSPSLREKAMGDEKTEEVVFAEHRALVERTRSFGVPTIVLDGGDGPAIFGPVISEPPADDDTAVALWRHVAWLTRYENFSELKRERVADPELASFRRARERKAQKG